MDGVPLSAISDYCKDVVIHVELGKFDKQKVDVRTFIKYMKFASEIPQLV